MPPCSSTVASTGPLLEICARLSGTVFSAMVRIVPSGLTNTMSSGTGQFSIHMALGCGAGQMNSMPPFGGIEVRYISPTCCSRGVRASSTEKSWRAPPREMMVSGCFCSSGCAWRGSLVSASCACARASAAARMPSNRKVNKPARRIDQRPPVVITASPISSAACISNAWAAQSSTASRTGPSRGASRKVVSQCSGGLRPAARG